MDIFEGIHSEMVSSNRFNENSDISTTYLVKKDNGGNQDKMKAGRIIPYIRKWLHLG